VTTDSPALETRASPPERQESVVPRPLPVTGRPGWPLPLPTRRAAGLVAASAVPVLFGVVHPALPLLSYGAWVVLLVATLLDWLLLPAPRSFTATRTNRPVLSLGGEELLPVEIALNADGESWLDVRLSDHLHARIERLGDPGPGRVRAGRSVVFETRARPRRRGRHSLRRVDARFASRLGLAEKEVRFDVLSEVRVYPGVHAIGSAARMLRRGLRQEAGIRRSRRRGRGTSFESLREYVPGEETRHMDWKATAKRGKLIVRRYEVERSQNVILMLDAGRWMTSEVAGLTRLDHVLNAALLLAHVAASRDDRVGALAFHREILAWVPPSKGRGAVERIMEAVYDIEPVMDESDYGGAFTYLASRHRKRSLVILLTDVLSREASRAVVEEARRSARRHVPLIVTLRDTDLDALANGEPGNASAAFNQAAAEELLQEREQALAVMRASGVHVLDCAPEKLGPALLDRYLDLKARMLI